MIGCRDLSLEFLICLRFDVNDDVAAVSDHDDGKKNKGKKGFHRGSDSKK